MLQNFYIILTIIIVPDHYKLAINKCKAFMNSQRILNAFFHIIFVLPMNPQVIKASM